MEKYISLREIHAEKLTFVPLFIGASGIYSRAGNFCRTLRFTARFRNGLRL